jgi:gluconolactonase
MKQPIAFVSTVTLCAVLWAGATAHADERKVVRRSPAQPPKEPWFPAVGSVIRLDPAMDRLVATNAVIEKVATGMGWAEGPVWVWRRHSILFSDVPKNRVYEWDFHHDLTVFLKPSGNTLVESGQGSNGLTLDPQGRLVLAQHGDRRISRLEPDGSLTSIAEFYKWNRFNSPNDLVYRSNGDLYFTDPPYGLDGGNTSPAKEIPFNGVYRVDKNGGVTLLEQELTYPNGLAFSPDEKTLYIAVSDPDKPAIMAYEVKPDGTLNVKTRRVFFDAAPLAKAGAKGSPDGLKVDVHGNLWATGPGGVLVISPEGKHLGTVSTGDLVANCAWGHDGSVLYLTSNKDLCRIHTLTMGIGPGFQSK